MKLLSSGLENWNLNLRGLQLDRLILESTNCQIRAVAQNRSRFIDQKYKSFCTLRLSQVSKSILITIPGLVCENSCNSFSLPFGSFTICKESLVQNL